MSEPMKYRKKPVTIEAMRWDGSASSAGKVIDWVLSRPETTSTPAYWEKNETEHREYAELHIPTLEGVMIASPGDWIIIGVSNEVYPCKPYIFEATYEAVGDDD